MACGAGARVFVGIVLGLVAIGAGPAPRRAQAQGHILDQGGRKMILAAAGPGGVQATLAPNRTTSDGWATSRAASVNYLPVVLTMAAGLAPEFIDRLMQNAPASGQLSTITALGRTGSPTLSFTDAVATRVTFPDWRGTTDAPLNVQVELQPARSELPSGGAPTSLTRDMQMAASAATATSVTLEIDRLDPRAVRRVAAWSIARPPPAASVGSVRTQPAPNPMTITPITVEVSRSAAADWIAWANDVLVLGHAQSRAMTLSYVDRRPRAILVIRAREVTVVGIRPVVDAQGADSIEIDLLPTSVEVRPG